MDFISFSVAFLYSLAYLIFYDQKRAFVSPRARASLGARARGPGWPWGWGRIAGGAAARKGALGLDGEEFVLRVMVIENAS
ncbi:MAG: hypothetical protein WCP70_06240 [Methanothrix sp.]